MPPKDKDKNKSKPEKCAELKEGWAENTQTHTEVRAENSPNKGLIL